MNVRYYVDPQTGRPHMLQHGVSAQEVEEVLARPSEDRLGYDGARVAVGKTRGGRYLRVVYRPEPEGIFVITSYPLCGKPLRAYKRRARRRES